MCLATALLFQGRGTESRPLDHALDYWKSLDLAQQTNFYALQRIMDWHLMDMTGSRLLYTMRPSKAQIPWMSEWQGTLDLFVTRILSFLRGSSPFHSNQSLFPEFPAGELDMTCFALLCMLSMSLPEGFTPQPVDQADIYVGIIARWTFLGRRSRTF